MITYLFKEKTNHSNWLMQYVQPCCGVDHIQLTHLSNDQIHLIQEDNSQLLSLQLD